MFVKLYLIALPLFLLVDMLWLGMIAKSFYAKHVGFLMKTDVNWVAAVIFYLLFVVGLVFFVIYPGLEKRSWQYVILAGGLFGLIAYATYDLTNLATLRDWPLIVTLVDLVWGAVLATLVSVLTYIIANKAGL